MANESRMILAAFDKLEDDLQRFMTHVPLVKEHLRVWSPLLVACVLEACSQLDSLWKLRSPNGERIDICDHFRSHSLNVAAEWLVVWGFNNGGGVHPFRAWRKHPTYGKLPWWDAYNALKHHRWKNVAQATLRHAIDATGALFLAICHDEECGRVLVERDWLRSSYNSEITLEKLYTQPDQVQGVTFESKLFSYALGCSKRNFRNMAACYQRCSARFGNWLHARFGGHWGLR